MGGWETAGRGREGPHDLCLANKNQGSGETKTQLVIEKSTKYIPPNRKTEDEHPFVAPQTLFAEIANGHGGQGGGPTLFCEQRSGELRNETPVR